MTAFVSLLAPQVGAGLPPANPQEISDDEQHLITGLSNKLTLQAMYAQLRYLYYDGEQAVQNLGISVPEVLAGVRTVVDWPRTVVDRLVERSSEIDGFRLPNATEADSELAEHWQANDLDAEFPLVQQDSLVAGRGYLIVGSPDVAGDSPIVTVESPLNLAMMWDPRRRMVTAAYQSYEVEGVYKAALYLPDVTISMSRDEAGSWVVDDRDEHMFGEVPVVRFSNRGRASDREGRSQITRPIMDTTDSVCRTLLAMEIGREVASIPHLWVLGGKRDNFVNADGSPAAALSLAMTRFNVIERDAKGEVPTLQQVKAFDPSVFTKIIDEHAQLMASYSGFPPSYFGQASTENPSSADAIRVGMDGVERGAKRVQLQATAGVRKAGQLMWRFANNGQPLPDAMRRLSVDWVNSKTPTPAADSDAMAKQIESGAVPARSDVTLRELGYNAVDRARLAQDADQAALLAAQLASSFAAREARASNAIATDLEKAVPVTSNDLPQPPQSR